MIDLTQRFDLGSKDVAAKVMDGEAVIINLATGVYYSMDKVGAVLWSLIQSGQRLEQCMETVVNRYDVGPEQVRTDTERLLQELIQEQLITPSNRAAVDAMDNEAKPAQDLPYASPQLNIYRDMGDLLALDPPTPGLQNSPWGSPDADELPS